MLRKEFSAGKPKDASKLHVGIVVARFNGDITRALLDGARATLRTWKVKDANIQILHVPGAFEIPLGCAKLLKKKFDCILALGCVIKGETKHDEYISHAVAQGLTRLMLDTGVPIGFGVITPNNLAQARARARGKANHGAAAARAALEMALVN